MSDSAAPPAGWSLAHFEAVCVDVGSWTWGTVQGAFNEKASVSQIIVDAVIGMIPLVGDATAVRDLLAVIIGMADDEEKRRSTWQWVLLAILLFALFPVIGGVVKGVGRLGLKIAQEAAHLAGPARKAHLEEGAREIIEFLNRIGVGNAERWFKALRVSDHARPLVEHFTQLMQTLITILRKTRTRVAVVAPSLARRMESLQQSLGELLEQGKK